MVYGKEKDRPASTDKMIGYGSPPIATRFKKGISGNPKGRPKGAKNKLRPPDGDMLGALILEEANRMIKVNDGSGQITMPMAQAIIRSLAVAAAKGQPRAQQQFLKIYDEKERKRKQSHDETLYALIEYKEKGEEQIRLHAKLGIDPPELYPHPSHIKIDYENETFEITGPISKDHSNQRKEEIRKRLEKQFNRMELSIAELEAFVETEEGKQHEETVQKDIQYEKELLSRFERRIAALEE